MKKVTSAAETKIPFSSSLRPKLWKNKDLKGQCKKTWLLFHHIPNQWGLLQIQVWKMNSRKWGDIYSKDKRKLIRFAIKKKTDENSLGVTLLFVLNFFFRVFSWIIEVERNQFSLLLFPARTFFLCQNSQFEPITLHSSQLPCVLCSHFLRASLEAKRSRKRYLCKIDLSDFQHGCNWSWHIAQCLQFFFKTQVNHVSRVMYSSSHVCELRLMTQHQEF